LYTHTPEATTVVCVDELGPLIPRAYPVQPGWTADGNRVKKQVVYWREPEKTWIYGGLRIRDGHAVTMSAERRNSVCYQQFLAELETDNPAGDIVVITENLSSHTSVSTREWLADHPRMRQVFIPKNACWLNLQEPWWRMFRQQGLAGQELASGERIGRLLQTPKAWTTTRLWRALGRPAISLSTCAAACANKPAGPGPA
jgi:hypothetical protein